MNKILLFLFIFLPIIVIAQPGNDECNSATVVPVSPNTGSEYWTEGTFESATASPEDSVCTGIANDDIWFRFTATANKHKMSFFGALPSNSKTFVIYENSCGGSTISCDTFSQYGYRMLSGLTPGEEYYIRFYSTSGIPSSSGMMICITAASEPMEISSAYSTPEELVQEMLMEFDPEYISVTNVATTSGNNFGDENGVAGYTSSNDPLFDFPSNFGIMLSTGNAEDAVGHNALSLGAGTNAWPGDADLEEILGPGDTGGFVNASSLEFDFLSTLPASILSEWRFDYIFASEDYGPGQCGPSDAFAIIVTNLNTGDKMNIATIPDTAIPVTTNTIRDNAYNAACPSENSDHFGSYYSTDDAFAIRNFNGCTKLLSAGFPIESGTPYHLKFVIADRGDTLHDSALFIAGGINIGVPALQAPTAVSPQQFTEGETLADIEIEGENVQWYTSATSSEPLPMDTPLQDGVIYYASQTVNGIESIERTPVEVFYTLRDNDHLFSNLSYYPNPVNDILVLSNNSTIDSVLVYNIVGQTVLQKEVNDTTASLDLSGSAPGVYFVKIVSGKAERTIKVIKK